VNTHRSWWQARGTVDVEQQGRVRELDGLDSFSGTVSQVEITFGDFGLPVSVSPPPGEPDVGSAGVVTSRISVGPLRGWARCRFVPFCG
jgi:hypothetical protein